VLVHAFLITAYRDAKALQGVLEQILAIDGAQIYLHLDSRSKALIGMMRSWLEEPPQKALFAKRLHWQANQAIRWASSDHFQVQMDLARKASRQGADYFHTITGQCRLVVSAKAFVDFFEKEAPRSFLDYFPIPAPQWSGNGGLDRIQYYQLYDFLDARKYPRLFDRLNQRLLAIQRALGISRLASYDFLPRGFWGGLGYWSLHRNALATLIDHPAILTKHYRHSLCAEEFAPHSILMSSQYAKTHADELIANNLRFVLWEKAHDEMPGILDERQFLTLQQSSLDLGLQEGLTAYPYLFARKFDSTLSSGLIAQLKAIGT